MAVIIAIKYFSDRHRSFSYGGLVSFGLLMFALGYGCLVLGICWMQDAKMSAGWLFLSFFLMAIGELCVIPILVSAVIGLSPRNWQGGMMGLLLMVAGVGAYFSNDIGQFITPDAGNTTLETYQQVFFGLMSCSVVSAL